MVSFHLDAPNQHLVVVAYLKQHCKCKENRGKAKPGNNEDGAMNIFARLFVRRLEPDWESDLAPSQ